MALPGELKGTKGATCDCGTNMDLSVCQSAAGYYLGYTCPNCYMPFSRESEYFSSSEQADLALEGDADQKLRSSEWAGWC